ncbi:serine/threonine-protein kinase [Hyalangium rubrum]|uniref:Protein kinase n=1 Tax=Hyalangium rubrum TaxID=3103134 RepID=A0ABU5GWF5_9BACT|nr:protein kinase [Hyalangium sp. s54d21]MDY7224892.1 protein kinase [Hyalangium sp. s54d21]
MSARASLSCSTCGNSVPVGAMVCPHDGTLVPDAMLGQHLGEYVVRRHIGSGGMGIVYEGEHLTIGRKVAIKLIREEQSQGAHARGLLAEARAASAIRHHGIIDIFGFGQQPGVGQYLVMEYLEGSPLNERLQAHTPLPLTEAVALLCEVLDALSAAHAVGVIHRDLKPSNIFVARQSNGTESIKVLDFGLAKRSTTPQGTIPQTHSDVVVGTPQYMSPEQALCEAVSPQTDLYAVGVIAFELLTGQRPFTGRSPMEIVAHHLKTPPPAPSLLVELPPELDALVLQLLAKEPQRRPGSASEVASQLRKLLPSREGSGLHSGPRSARALTAVEHPPATPPTATLQPAPGIPSPKATPPKRRSLWGWSAAAGGVLTLVFGLGAVMTRESHPPAPLIPAPSLVAQPATSPSLTQVVLQPPRSEPEPIQALAPAPVPTATVRRREAAPSPARRKAPVVPPPADALAASVQPVSAPPVPALPEPAPPEPAPQPAATGILHLVMKGTWADVWVDGQKLGRVPPTHSYTLSAGAHELELRNPAFANYRRTLVIPAGGKLQHIADLSAEASSHSP